MIISSRGHSFADLCRSFEELARSTEDFNGAQLKAVCVEAGMVSRCGPVSWQLWYLMTLRPAGRSFANHPQLALRQGATKLNHEHFYGGILEVQAKKAKEHHVSDASSDYRKV